MDFSAGSSSSSTSKVFYSQPSSSQLKVYEGSQKDLGINFISLPVTTNDFNTFSDEEVIVLSSSDSDSDSEEEPELISTDNQFVSNKAKGKEREHSTEPDFGTISSAVGINIAQLNKPELFSGNQPIVYDKGKGKEREHSTERDFGTSAGLNIDYIDDPDDELVDMEIDFDIPQPETILSNQLISWAIDTEPAVNQAPREQQSREPNCVEKVVKFFNCYDYTFDIFDIVIDLSNKYQEIFKEDSGRLQHFHNNPCVLLELLPSLLLMRLNAEHGVDFVNLETLAAEYYEKLKNAEIDRRGLYRTSFRNNKFHSTAKALNEEKKSIIKFRNFRADSNPLSATQPATRPAIQEKKKMSKKARKAKERIDLGKILSSAIQSSQMKTETKAPPLLDHLNGDVFNQGNQQSMMSSITQSTSNLSLDGNYNEQNFSSSVFPDFSSFYGVSNEHAMASTSSNTGLQPATATTSYDITPNPQSNNEITETTGYVPDETGKEYTNMMADAIQKLAVTTLAMKYNPESGPGELDKIVNKFKVKKSGHAQNGSLIQIYNIGGMGTVISKLEENVSSHLKVKPKEIKRQKKKRRILQNSG